MAGRFELAVLLTLCCSNVSALQISDSYHGQPTEMFSSEDDESTCKARKGKDANFSAWSGCWSIADQRRMMNGNLSDDLATCGFMDKTSTLTKRALTRRFGHCKTVIYSVAFKGSGMFYGAKPAVLNLKEHFGHLAEELRPACPVFFVDKAFHDSGFVGHDNFNGTHWHDWELFIVDPWPFPGDAPRSAHVVKWLGPAMFPNAKRSFVYDTKTDERGMVENMRTDTNASDSLANDLSSGALVQLLNRKDYGVVLWKSPRPHRDASEEFPATVHHLKGRHSDNLKMELEDVHRSKEFLESEGYNLRGSGMANYFKVIFNHEKPCITYSFCMLHNLVSFLSMRDQLFYPYIFDALGIYDDIVWADGIPSFRYRNYKPFPSSDPPVRPRARISLPHDASIQC